MTGNPYEPPSIGSETAKTERIRWLVWLGIGSLGLAACCFVATFFGIMASFEVLAESDNPSPQQLARGISIATIPGYAILPLGVLGVGLILAGLLMRRPAAGSAE